MSSSTRISRRGLLGVGAAAALSPILRSTGAYAQSAAPPKRLVIVFTADGTVYPNFVPTGSETSFTLSPILAPLMPYQSKLLVLDNVNNEAARHGDGDDPMRGMGSMLTGIALLPGTTIRTARFAQFATPQLWNNVMVSLANAMGATLTTFGNPAYCTGPAPNLH